MVTINNAKLKEVLEAYKLYFKDHIDDEIYKWVAVKKFQDSWNIEATDFKTMFKEATSKHENLLVSRQKYPLAMILEFCDKEVETVREMFRNLFDESLELKDRLVDFRKSSDALVDKYAPGKMHYQDVNTLSTYLWLRYPDKYYIYKYSGAKASADVLESSLTVKKGYGRDMIKDVFELYEQITKCVCADTQIQKMIVNELTDDCYTDPAYHAITIDIVYFISKYFQQYNPQSNNVAIKQKYWIYSPGEGARMWDDCITNGLMCLGWDSLGDYTQYETREDMVKKMQIDYNTDKSCKNDSLATWEFAYEMNPGDIIFVKKGRSTILGRGVVLTNYIYDDKRQDYKNVRSVKWEKIGQWTLDELTPMKTLTDISKYTDYVNRLNALVEGNSVPEENCNYWYLCTNPKMFSIMDWPVGDTQEFTLKNDNGNKRQRPQNFIDAKAGDKVICYASSPIKQVTSLAIVSREQDGETIEFEKTETLPYPIDLKTIHSTSELQNVEGLPNFQGTLFKLTKDEYDKILDLVRESNAPVNQKSNYEPYTEEDFLNEVYLPNGEFYRLKNLLINKKNIILQGAPGVGKTYSARRLAYAMMGEKDDSRISLIQFHQNYSYEDFILGYKPSGDTFELQRGIFYKFCINAANDPNNDYFFIIDEINRGNLSKIFGELMMLIEKDYRGQKLTLAYNDETFFVPKNVYIIGMMNTADRSLAMIDYALRRRFSFFEMKPGFVSDGFKKYIDKFSNEHFNKMIELIKNLNENIRKDDSLGEGFEIGHSYFCGQDQVDDNWLHQVIDYDIIPMLNEYWFDNKKEIETWKIKLNSIFND